MRSLILLFISTLAYANEDLATVQALYEQGPGRYIVELEHGEVVWSVDPGEVEYVPPQPGEFKLVPEDSTTVFVCQGGANGGSIEPEGSDFNDGLSMDSAFRTLKRATAMARELGPGTDLVLCEGGLWIEQLVLDWGGTPVDRLVVTGYVNHDGEPGYMDPTQMCGGKIGEFSCPE